MNSFDRKNLKRYYVELAGSIVFYFALMLFTGWLFDVGVADPWKPYVIQIPMIAFGLLLWTFYRMYRRMDEMQRVSFLETIAFSFFGTAFVTFGYGFAEAVGAPKLSMHMVWVCMGGFWFVITQYRWIRDKWTTS